VRARPLAEGAGFATGTRLVEAEGRAVAAGAADAPGGAGSLPTAEIGGGGGYVDAAETDGGGVGVGAEAAGLAPTHRAKTPPARASPTNTATRRRALRTGRAMSPRTAGRTSKGPDEPAEGIDGTDEGSDEGTSIGSSIKLVAEGRGASAPTAPRIATATS
jgi:hypothetical protein